MSKLEKILNEIKASSVYGETKDGYGASIISMGAVERIIRKHIDNNGWIPVSRDNIPEYEVWCCDKYGNVFMGFLSKTSDGYSCDTNECLMDDIIAWQPLPEPYKPKEGEQI